MRKAIRVSSVLAILVSGVLIFGEDVRADEGHSCGTICATFCPADEQKYCADLGCESNEDADCEEQTCIRTPYHFPNSIYCTGGGGSQH